MAETAETPMEVGRAGIKILVKLFPLFKKVRNNDEWEKAHDVDGETLNHVFTSTLGIPPEDIQFERGRKAEEITEALQKLNVEAKSCDAIFIVFVVDLYKNNPNMINFYDEPMLLSDIFDLVKDIAKPKVIIVQADDENLIPRKKTDEGDSNQAQRHRTEPLVISKLPKESLLLMSTFPLKMAQFEKAEKFVETWTSTAGKTSYGTPKESVRCSVLVRAFKEVLESPGVLKEDFRELAEKINRRVSFCVQEFGTHPEIPWEEPPSPYMECNLTGPLYLM